VGTDAAGMTTTGTEPGLVLHRPCPGRGDQNLNAIADVPVPERRNRCR
jgi:hypothetical protein